MTRSAFVLPLLFACQAVEPETESITTGIIWEDDNPVVYEVEGGYRGDLTSVGLTDPVGLDDREALFVVTLMEVNGSHGHIDVSMRPGLGNWLIGRGTVEILDGNSSGPFEAKVSDGTDTHCEIFGEWSAKDGMVDADLLCWNNEVQESAYVVEANRF